MMAHEGGYSEVYVPFCGHAVLQEMSGSDDYRTEDPFKAATLRSPPAVGALRRLRRRTLIGRDGGSTLNSFTSQIREPSCIPLRQRRRQRPMPDPNPAALAFLEKRRSRPAKTLTGPAPRQNAMTSQRLLTDCRAQGS